MTRVQSLLREHLVLVLGVLIIAGSFLTSTGMWNVDELIYFLGADAVAARGSFIVENGYEAYGHDHLRILFLIAGPNGLTPQYPVGTAILGAPFIQLLGVRGLVVLYALAAVACLWFVHRLARQLYDNRAVANIAVLITCFASYFLEFAFGVGSHALSALAVLAALSFAVQSIQDERLLPAILSGVAIGFGILIRVDTILILPAIGVLVLMYGGRPVMQTVSGLAGMIPGLGISSWANQFKFGTWNPISYGYSEGAGHLGGHSVAIVVVLALVLATIGLRQIEWRRHWGLPLVGLAGAGFVAVVATGLAEGTPLQRLLRGLYVLLIDMRGITDIRPGMEPLENGVRIFFGIEKKALAQSLPWLGVLALLIVRPWHNRFAHLVILTSVAIWVLPFSFLEWHGGMGSNMRYFLPVVPLLCILGAALTTEFLASGRLTPRSIFLSLLAGVLIVSLWAKIDAQEWAAAGQQLGLWIFAVVAVSCLGAPLHPVAQHAARFGILVALGAAFTLSVVRDVSTSQRIRAQHDTQAKAMAQLPRPNVFVGPVAPYGFQSRRDDGLIVVPQRLGEPLDAGFISTLLQDGYRVHMDAPVLESFLIHHPEMARAPKQPVFPKDSMAEIVLRDSL